MDCAACKGHGLRRNLLMQKTKHDTALMKRYFPTLLCGLAFLMAALRPASAQTQLSPTRYDYSQVAQQITQGCTTDYDRAKAIYRWLCANISYDTSYSIYTADDCWDRKRGVCQAYCELFCRLAEPLDIRAEIISGSSKSRDGTIGRGGHSWIFAVTDRERNLGILIDPTWGAGQVNGTTFTRREDMSWFEVSPEWLIFTHYPENPAFQFLAQPLSYGEFAALPALQPFLGTFGLDGQSVLQAARSGRETVPEFYDSDGEKLLRLVQIPMQGTLRVGETYTFALAKKAGCEFALFNNGEMVGEEEWQANGTHYRLSFTPSGGDDLHFGIYNSANKNYQTVFRYKVAAATAADLEKLARKRPFSMPEIKRFGHIDTKRMEAIGISGQRLLEFVRQNRVSRLPELYGDGRFTAEDIPLDGLLKVGRAYTFRIKPHEGKAWAVINGDKWYRDWQLDPATGAWEISVVPASAGKLGLAVQKEDGGSFHYSLVYSVAE